MLRTVTLLVIWGFVFTTCQKEFPCGSGFARNQDSDEPNKANCCTQITPTVSPTPQPTAESKCSDSYEFSCSSDKGYAYNSDNDNEKASNSNCCKLSVCGTFFNGEYDCGTDMMQARADDAKLLERNATNCCQDFAATCLWSTKYVPGGADPYGCPAAKLFNIGAALTEFASGDGETTCCVAKTCDRYSIVPDITSVYIEKPFDCNALGMQMKTNYKAGEPTKDTCCDDFVATCGKPNVDSNFPFQCGDGLVYDDGDDGVTDPNATNCCKDQTCADYYYPKCSSVDCTNLQGSPGMVNKASLSDMYYVTDDKNCCMMKGDSTSSSTRLEAVYSFFLLAAIFASAA